jgi:hypothetical protein
MEWHYSKNGQQHGPVSETELRSMVQDGSVAPTDLAWYKGMDGWKPVGEIPEFKAQAQAPPSAPSVTPPPRQVATSSIQTPKRLTQQQKADIHTLKQQMKEEYERFVEETHMRAAAEFLDKMKIGLFKKRDDVYNVYRKNECKDGEPQVFYYEGGSIIDNGKRYTRIWKGWSDRKQSKLEKSYEAALKAEQKGKYDPEFPSLDEFMEWRWRDLDNRGGLEEGLIEAVQRSQ